MLIAISGSQGCGKSTILEYLKENQHTVVERKTSRSILQEWGVDLSKVNNDTELLMKFQDEIIERKFNDEKKHIGTSPRNIVFTERTYADLFTYAMTVLGKDNKHNDWVNEYYTKCLRYQSQSYSHVFYLKGGMFPVVVDLIRGSNKHYSKMIELTMTEYTKQMTTGSKLTFIDTANIDDRVDIIQQQVYTIANL